MKPATRLTACVLSLVAAAHLLRLVLSVPVTVDGWAVPLWVSAVGTIVPVALVFGLWREHAGQGAATTRAR